MELDQAIEQLEHSPAVYVLSGTRENYLYKGSCGDLPKRLSDHRAGRVSRTKSIRPLDLVYFEYFTSISEARKRELFLKTGVGREFIADQLKGKG